MGELGGIGDVVTGAVLARAVKPDAGEVASDGHSHEAACLNCNTPLTGDYCHACGQRGHVHRTLGAFAHDLIHGVLHFEGKIWRTLPLLAGKPGELTRRYIEGQRARFVSPIALFLFSVFLMFAVVSWIGGPNINSPEINAGLVADAATSEASAARLAGERAEAVAAGRATALIDRKIAAARDEAQLLKAMADRGVVQGGAVRLSDDVPEWIAAPLRRAAANPELLLYKVQNNAYKFSWALIPLSLPFMWLLFPFSRRFRLYDHIVFVTYSLAFMTLLVSVASVLGAVGWSAAAGMMMLLPPIHIYRQLRGAYGLSRFGALWRTVLLTVFAMTVVGLFIAMLFALGIF